VPPDSLVAIRLKSYSWKNVGLEEEEEEEEGERLFARDERNMKHIIKTENTITRQV